MTDIPRPVYKRRGFIIAAIAVGVPVLAFAWYLGSPLFLNTTVIEEFPRAAGAEIPDDMTIEEVEAKMFEAAEATVTPAAESMPDDGTSDPVALFTGSFAGADSRHQGSGNATVYELADGSTVLRFENLDVTNGPDLHVILSPVADPETREDVSTPGYVDLGSLKGNRGDQNYDIPTEVDLTSGDWTVVIYCQPFHVIFATAGLISA